MSGPSATVKPIRRKIAAVRSMSCVMGCSLPRPPHCPGSERSNAPARAAFAPASSSALRALTASVTPVLKRLRAWPIAFLSVAVLSSAINSGSIPFRPMYLTRSASSASKSAAPATAANASSVRETTS